MSELRSLPGPPLLVFDRGHPKVLEGRAREESRKDSTLENLMIRYPVVSILAGSEKREEKKKRNGRFARSYALSAARNHV